MSGSALCSKVGARAYVFHDVDHHVVLDQLLALLPVRDGGRRGTLFGHVEDVVHPELAQQLLFVGTETRPAAQETRIRINNK